MKIQVEPRLVNLLREAGCTGYVTVIPSGPADDLFNSVRVTIFHDGDTCPLHESDKE